MKFVRLFLQLIFVGILLASCYQEDDFSIQSNIAEAESSVIVKDELTLEQKLTNIQKSGEDILTRSLYANESQLQLKEYKNIGVITTEKELDQLKSVILSNESYFPYYDTENSNISLLTWSEIECKKQNEKTQYSKSDLETFLNTVLKVGMNKMELTWECNSKTYKTICITSNEDIIYDNVIMNILCISEESPLNKGLTPIIKTKSPESNFSGSCTNTLRWTAYWLWGSECGRVEINHTIYVSTGNLTNSTSSEDAYISIGSAGADSQIKECSKGVGGYSICNYAYYLATPTVSVSISGGNGIDFSISTSGIGSEASGSGDNYLSASNL